MGSKILKVFRLGNEHPDPPPSSVVDQQLTLRPGGRIWLRESFSPGDPAPSGLDSTAIAEP